MATCLKGRKKLRYSTSRYVERLTKGLRFQFKTDAQKLWDASAVIRLSLLERPIKRFRIRRSEFAFARPRDEIILLRCNQEQDQIRNGRVVSVDREDVKIKLLKQIKETETDECKVKLFKNGKIKWEKEGPKKHIELKLKIGDRVEWAPANDDSICRLKVSEKYLRLWCRRVEVAIENLNSLKRSTLIHKSILHQLDDPDRQTVIRGPIDPHLATGLPELKDIQKRVVEFALRRKISLVDGVVGSGKTLIAANLAYHLASVKNYRVLICSPSQAAVNKLSELLQQIPDLKSIQLPPDDLKKTKKQVAQILLDKNEVGPDLDLLTGISIYKRFERKIARYGRHGLDAKSCNAVKCSSDWLWKKERKKILQGQHVVCCTLSQAGCSTLRKVKFEALIIDDAHLASEFDCLVALMTRGLKRVTVLGDMQTLKTPPKANDECSNSHQTMIMSNLFQIGSPFETWISESYPLIQINHQYRMRAALSIFPKDQFYSPKLRTDRDSNQRLENRAFSSRREFSWLPYPRSLTALFDAPTNMLMVSNTVSKIINYLIHDHGVKRSNIGLISNIYKGSRDEFLGIKLGTVRDFIGVEKDFIILSCYETDEDCDLTYGSCRIDYDFTRNDLALRIALTRARLGLFIVMGHSSEAWKKAKMPYIDEDSSNSECYCQSWQDLYKYYKKKGYVTERELD